MPNFLASKKLAYVRRTGPDLVLNLTNAPWLANVLKITALTTPSGSGSNSRSSYTGAFGGLAPGGTLTTVRQGQSYELNLGKFDGSFSLPDFVEVVTLVEAGAGPSGSDTYSFSAGLFDPLVLLYAPAIETARRTFSGLSYTNDGLLEISINGSAFGSVSAANAAIASSPLPYTTDYRLTRTLNKATTATLIAS